VTGFSGDFIYYGITETGGKLWYYELNIPSLGGNRSLIEYSDTQPSGGISNVREAKLDLSGFSALAGFIFRF
jgi:hypothetical protein